MKNINFWSNILDELKNNKNVILILVAKAEGWTPGNVGFKLALTQAVKTFGTIGGGKIEFDAIEKAKKIIKQNNTNPIIEHYSLTNKLSENSDAMICGGKQTIIFFTLQSTHVSNIEKIISIYKAHKQGVIEINSDNNISVIPTTKMSFNSPLFFYETEIKWEYVEPIGIEPIIHIIGGGHVSLALSQILSMLSYYIIVYDERSDIDTFINNTYADEKKVIPFNEVHKQIEETDRTHIIIMTPGHKSDEIVLRNTIAKNVRYVGMMASPKKQNEIIDKLKSDGYNYEVLSKLHSPIGLPINSHTPAEIAVSIAAELVKVNNKYFEY